MAPPIHGPLPPVPISGTNVVTPLTLIQREQIANWLRTTPGKQTTQSLGDYIADLGHASPFPESEIVLWENTGHNRSGNNMDWAVAKLYNDTLAGGGGTQGAGAGGENVHKEVTAPSWMQAIGNFFGRLVEPQTWIRVAEFAGGVVILGVGAAAVVKSGMGSRTPVTSGAKSTFKIAKKVVK